MAHGREATPPAPHIATETLTEERVPGLGPANAERGDPGEPPRTLGKAWASGERPGT